MFSDRSIHIKFCNRIIESFLFASNSVSILVFSQLVSRIFTIRRSISTIWGFFSKKKTILRSMSSSSTSLASTLKIEKLTAHKLRKSYSSLAEQLIQKPPILKRNNFSCRWRLLEKWRKANLWKWHRFILITGHSSRESRRFFILNYEWDLYQGDRNMILSSKFWANNTLIWKNLFLRTWTKTTISSP